MMCQWFMMVVRLTINDNIRLLIDYSLYGINVLDPTLFKRAVTDVSLHMNYLKLAEPSWRVTPERRVYALISYRYLVNRTSWNFQMYTLPSL